MVHTIIIPKPITVTSTNESSLDHEKELLHRQMLSSVSHDLKTPLASIIGALEVYERMGAKLSDDQRGTLVNVALQESYRLDNFITNILDMAKFENNMVRLTLESGHVRGIISDCIARMNVRLNGSQIILGMENQLEIRTDISLLSRTICHLLDNAVKYGGKPAVINIDFGKKNDDAFITVHDNGIGIPQARMEAIFSKYTRFGNEDQQNAGTGLGLSISRASMKLLGGSVEAENHPQGGAVFTLTLPLSGPKV